MLLDGVFRPCYEELLGRVYESDVVHGSLAIEICPLAGEWSKVRL